MLFREPLKASQNHFCQRYLASNYFILLIINIQFVKIQAKQAEKAKKLMTKSVGELDEDRMMNRLPDIARRMRTYFVQVQRNVVPFKKVVDQLKQSYPEAMTDCNKIFVFK